LWRHGLNNPKISLVVLAGLLCLTLPARMLAALTKPFWYDELFTVYLAQLPTLKSIQSALAAHVDTLPLAYYVAERAAIALPLDPHLGFRLPSILGYLAAIVGVYLFASRAFRPATGLAAACVLALSPFREYAIEARPYALVVGCVAIAAFAWQRAEEKRMYAVLLAGSLTMAVAFHHYAVVVLACFGAGELARLVKRRRWRWGVWTALGTATLPFWAGFPILLSYREVAGPHYWAKPGWAGVPSTYLLSGVSLAYWTALVSLAALATLQRWGRRKVEEPADGLRGLSGPEGVLIWGLLLFPALLSAAAAVAGGGYFVRYGWPFIVGFALICGLAMEFLAGTRRLAWVALALCAALFIREAFEMATYQRADVAGKATAPLGRLQAAETGLEAALPVAVANPMEHVPLAYYARPEQRKQLVTLTDVEASVRYTGTDSIALTVLALERFVPLGVKNAGTFLAGHSSFYLWCPTGQPDWILSYLADQGWSVKLTPARGAGLVYLIER